MGNPGRQQERESPSVQSSPRTSTSSNGNTNGGCGGGAREPKIFPLPETNPTTYVQADTSSFKQVVQMLTGSTETAAKHQHAAAAASAAMKAAVEAPSSWSPIPPAKTGPKRPAFKLYERRHSSFKNLTINPLMPELLTGGGGGEFSPRKKPEILSPSVLDLPSLTLSPVTPLIPDPFNRPPHPGSPAAMLVEERAIAKKGFYLHPSPRTTTPRDAEPPKLLPLFPVTSPRVSSPAPSAAAASASP